MIPVGQQRLGADRLTLIPNTAYATIFAHLGASCLHTISDHVM